MCVCARAYVCVNKKKRCSDTPSHEELSVSELWGRTINMPISTEGSGILNVSRNYLLF